jgi:hypothetical protein
MGELDARNVDLSRHSRDARADYATEAWEVGLPSEESLRAGRAAATRDAPSFRGAFHATLEAAKSAVGSALKAGTQRTFAPEPGGSDPFAGLATPPRRVAS